MENTNNEFIKISFIGDIMCEMPLLKASKVNDKEYNFDKVFQHMKEVFNQSDYIVGNLETICAGKELGYTNHIYSFNTPNEFIDSIKKSGVDLVTTATNHSLDRGVKGLKNSLETLEMYDLKSIGTYQTEEDSNEVFVENIEGTKISFLNYTFGTNAHINGVKLNNDELFHINLLKPQDEELRKYNYKTTSRKFKSVIARLVFKIITLEQWIKLKRILGLKYNQPYQDNDLSELNSQYLNKIKMDIKKAKEFSDIVVMCIHSGGQFHPKPGKFSEFMMHFMNEHGVDVVVGNHPHVVQRSEVFANGMFGAYSLGNFSISPSSVYVLYEDLPEYSIMLHLYLGKKTKKIEKITFSILKIVEYADKSLSVYPIDKLIEIVDKEEKQGIIKSATKIYNRFLNKSVENIQIKCEYVLEN